MQPWPKNPEINKRMPETVDPKNPKIRGAALSTPLTWLQETYGPEVFQRALQSLSPEEQALFRRGVVSVSWYPLLSWERFVLAYQKEVTALTGISADNFRSKLMMEGGGKLIKTLYRFIFSMFQPQTILSRLFSINARLYDQGESKLLQNEPGLCVARFLGPLSMYSYTRSFTLAGMVAALELTGSKNINVSIVTDEKRGSEFVIEVKATYQAPT
jgi:hypothetical protein